jgi:hypothetical protein
MDTSFEGALTSAPLLGAFSNGDGLDNSNLFPVASFASDCERRPNDGEIIAF